VGSDRFDYKKNDFKENKPNFIFISVICGQGICFISLDRVVALFEILTKPS
jgi:hypothetical protein